MQSSLRRDGGSNHLASVVGGVLSLVALLTVPPQAAWAADLTIQRGLVGQIETLDPQKAATANESAILIDLFEGLVTVDALGRPVPGAAASWTVSPDGLHYTFKLRDDGRWSNGAKVTADDFVASFQRLFAPETGATEDGALQVIKNAAPIKEGIAKPDSLGVTATDPLTLEITLEQPTPTFPLRLAEPVALPVSVTSIKKLGEDFGTTGKIVSNGPFRLGAVDDEEGYVLQKNPRFRLADATAADNLVYHPFETAEDCLAAFRAEAVQTCSDVPAIDLDALRGEFGTALQITPYEGTYFYAFNTAKKPFDDVRVRRALSLAIDRDALAREAWSGGMVPALGLVPSDLSLHPASSIEPIAQRRAEATHLLEEAGFGSSKAGLKQLKLEIRVGTGAAHEETARLVAEQWKAIGVDATVVTESSADHFARLRDGGDFDVARAGWILDEPDPIDILSLLSGSNARFNYARYHNRGYDELLAEAGTATDPETRQKRLAAAEQVVRRDVPVIPLLGYASLTLVSPDLTGWQPNVLNIHPSRFLGLAR